VSTANYTCGQRETAKHLLLDYKEYRKERKDLLNRIKKGIKVRQLTLPLIAHTKIGITNLLAFLKGTNICIRKWFLEREGEGRGEGVEREGVEREEGVERA
jgi:FAD synthase